MTVIEAVGEISDAGYEIGYRRYGMRDAAERSVDLNVGERVSRMALPSLIKRLLHEPLFHFLLIGVLLFAVDHYVNPVGGVAPSSKIVRV